VDAFDAAMDPMSGLTSQPCLGSLVEALRHTERDTGLDPDAIRRLSFYWEAVRHQYAAFESDLQSGASEVYLHEMPGGQFTNLREQARSLGLESRWHEVALAYRNANEIFGDIVKVTPSSKVVGDMALMMVSQGLTPADVVNPEKEISFPQSVVEMLHGDLGQPPGGWPAALQAKVLKGKTPIIVRPGSLLPPADLEAVRQTAKSRCGIEFNDEILASYLMYPDVFTTFNAAMRTYGPVSVLPTPVYFYGMQPGDEIAVTLQAGKTMIISLQTISETDDDGNVRVFFELNGQPRVISVPNRSVTAARPARRKADEADEKQLGAPMPGSISAILVREDQTVAQGEPLLAIEAMKMEAQITAPRDATVKSILVRVGEQLDAKDLLIEFV
jgi:pyruvate carboxylase